MLKDESDEMPLPDDQRPFEMSQALSSVTIGNQVTGAALEAYLRHMLPNQQRSLSAGPAMPDSERFYWDANVILAFFKAEPGRIEDVEAYLEDAQAGRIEIYTSVLSITEVAIASLTPALVAQHDANSPDPLDALWGPGPIRLADISTLVAEEARSIVRAANFAGRTVNRLMRSIFLLRND